jgi:hypothetical protein
MDTFILETYLSSIHDEYIMEGVTPSMIKTAIEDIRNKNVNNFMKKYGSKIRQIPMKQLEDEADKTAENVGIEKEKSTTSKVMLKRALGTILVGVSATVLIPITLACFIACVIRAIKNKESIIQSTLAIIKEIKSGIKTNRRTNITNMEKSIITAGQAATYLWGVMSTDPMVMIKNLLAFLGMFITAVYYFWKGIIFAGETINK